MTLRTVHSLFQLRTAGLHSPGFSQRSAARNPLLKPPTHSRKAWYASCARTTLPAFKRHTEEVGRLLPELYLHGLAHGDFDLALRRLLGDGAPLSALSIARLKAGWQAEYEVSEDARRRGARCRLPVGGRRVRERRAREGEGRDARRPGRVARWPEGDPGVNQREEKAAA